MPLSDGNPFTLARLAPGVAYTGDLKFSRPFDNGGMDNFQISGGRAFTNEFLLDGVPNTGTETTATETHASRERCRACHRPTA